VTSAPYWLPGFERLLAEAREYRGSGVLHVVALIPPSPAADEMELVEAGNWPLRLQLVELPAEHREMIDFLVEKAVREWPTT
jgi:hypothetical protein